MWGLDLTLKGDAPEQSGVWLDPDTRTLRINMVVLGDECNACPHAMDRAKYEWNGRYFRLVYWDHLPPKGN